MQHYDHGSLETWLCKYIFGLLVKKKAVFAFSACENTGELRVGSLKDFKDSDRVRHRSMLGVRGGGSIGSNKQPSPILKGQKSCKGFIDRI